jgi:hypothetical protein
MLHMSQHDIASHVTTLLAAGWTEEEILRISRSIEKKEAGAWITDPAKRAAATKWWAWNTQALTAVQAAAASTKTRWEDSDDPGAVALRIGRRHGVNGQIWDNA